MDQVIALAGAIGRVGHHLVDVLTERGHDVVPISRTHRVVVITDEGRVNTQIAWRQRRHD